MRAFALLATIYAAAVGTTSAYSEAGDVTTVGVYATDYDTRLSTNGGCDPAGCVAANTRDDDLSANSRWSCQGDGCCITYTLAQAQNIAKVRIAFHKGDERIRTLDVFENGTYHSAITSSGDTLEYENFYLKTVNTGALKLCLDDDGDDWLSITEVRLMVKT